VASDKKSLNWLDTAIINRNVKGPVRAMLKKQAPKMIVPTDFEQFYMTVMRRRFPSATVHFPYHLQEMIDAILNGKGERLVVAVPRRHSKTTTLLALAAYKCVKMTYRKSIYSSYSDNLVVHGAREFDEMIRAWGGPEKNGPVNEKRVGTNTVYFLSLRGSVTGKGSNEDIFVDDPVKDWETAKSPAELDKIFMNIDSCVFSGKENEDVNQVVCGTRWAVDDPQGRLASRPEWRLIHYRAIRDENGTEKALWPEVRPLSMMRRVRAESTDFTWSALMQGDPPSDRYRIFSDEVKTISQLPSNWRYKILRSAAGIDLAYSKNVGSDYKSFSLAHYLTSGEIVFESGFLTRANTNEFLTDIKGRLPIINGRPTAFWYTSAVEADRAYEIWKTYGIWINCMGSVGKLGNAQNLARIWNEGRVYVPDEWEAKRAQDESILAQILKFTGSESSHDDSVDSCSAAVDELTNRASSPTFDDKMLGIKIREQGTSFLT
jgi:hypothetical protein